MSGRPKPSAAASPAEELRELIREANGTVKDLRQLLREYRELRAALPADAGKAVQQQLEHQVNACMAEAQQALDGAMETIQKVIRTEEARTREHYATLLGRDTADLIVSTCGMILHLASPHVSVDEWKQQLANEAGRHLARGCNCLGCLALMPTSGGIFVVTDPADAPPGSVVIDMRDGPAGAGPG